MNGSGDGFNDEESDSPIVQKIAESRNTIADYISETLVVTDESLRNDFLLEIKKLGGYSTSPHRQDALRHADLLASTLESFDCLTEHSKNELRSLLAEAQVKLHGN